MSSSRATLLTRLSSSCCSRAATMVRKRSMVTLCWEQRALHGLELAEALPCLAQLVHGVLQVRLDAALGLELLLVAVERVRLLGELLVGVL